MYMYTHAMQHGCTIILTTPSHAGWDSTGYKLATFEHAHCSVHPVANVSHQFIDFTLKCDISVHIAACVHALIYQLHAYAHT